MRPTLGWIGLFISVSINALSSAVPLNDDQNPSTLQSYNGPRDQSISYRNLKRSKGTHKKRYRHRRQITPQNQNGADYYPYYANGGGYYYPASGGYYPVSGGYYPAYYPQAAAPAAAASPAAPQPAPLLQFAAPPKKKGDGEDDEEEDEDEEDEEEYDADDLVTRRRR